MVINVKENIGLNTDRKMRGAIHQFLVVDDLFITMLRDEVIFPASNEDRVDLQEDRLRLSYSQWPDI